jgi:hypothetical protein
MRFNHVLYLRLVSLAIGLSLLSACTASAPTTNAPSTTPPNGATSGTNSNAAPSSNANVANTNSQNPATSTSQSGGTADCGNCWVHIYDDKNFKATDDNHKICGPGAWPNLRNLAGAIKLNWSDEIESLRVGPGATVIVWTGEQFTGTSHTFNPGTEKITLKDMPGFSDNISSLEIKCQ